MEQTIELRLFS